MNVDKSFDFISLFKIVLCLSIILFSLNLYSQTYDAPALACVQRITNTNVLTWHKPVVTCGNFKKYYMYYSNSPTGPFILFDSVSQIGTLTYTHVGINKNAQYYYYMTSSFDCPGLVSTHSDTLDDRDLPKPTLLSISIENNYPIYRWVPRPDLKDVWAYLIVKEGVKIIDTVIGRDSSSYINYNFNIYSGPDTGQISLMDSCGGVYGRSAPTFAHVTSFLSINNNPCDNELSLSWTKYVGWSANNDVKEYQILVTKNSEPEKVVSTNDPSTLNFIYSDFKNGDTLSIRVKAIHPTDPTIYSYSNPRYLISRKNKKPDIFQLVSVSYIDKNITRLVWYCDTLSLPKAFNISKFNALHDIIINTKETVRFTNLGHGLYSYIDSNAIEGFQVSYAPIYIDSCNFEGQGAIGKTLYLTINQTGLYKNTLNWTPKLFADSILYTIAGYELYYSKDQINFTKLADLKGNNTEYDHVVENDLNNDGTYCYRLIAKYSFDTTAVLKGIEYRDTSNTQCIAMRTVLWMPNAFKVNGYTPMFKPKLIFFTSKDFLMEIFNRNGAMIYKTNDPIQGWNGVMTNGQMASEDTYIYKITYGGNDGVLIHKTGTFVLLK